MHWKIHPQKEQSRQREHKQKERGIEENLAQSNHDNHHLGYADEIL